MEEILSMEKKIFTLPKISKCKTFIYFSFWDAENYCYKRFKKYLSRKVPPQAVNATLKEMVAHWTVELRNGYNPFQEKENEEKATLPFLLGNICTTNL